jgi:AcrR family transcriptional regulator
MVSDCVTTPWGTSADLRRPLHGGPFPSQSPEETRREQRKRLQGAVIAATAERGGLAAVRFEDLNRLAGVSNSVVYELFGSKEGCVLATVDWLYRNGYRRVEAAHADEVDAEAALRAALATVVRLILDQPAAARFCVVDVYEAGAEGSRRVDEALRGFERLWRRSAAVDPDRAGLPPSMATAIVGAIQMLIHDRLRRRAEGGLPELIEPLAVWSLGYAPPPEPLRRPLRAGARPGPSPSTESPPEALLRGIAAAAAEHGARAMTVREIAGRARCSLSTLYSHFASKEDGFLGCFEEVRARTSAAAGAAYDARMPDWPRAIAAANAAIFAYLASEPDFARVAFAEVFAAGPDSRERRDEAVKGFADLLAPGFREAPQLPESMGEAMAFGVFALAHRQITRFGPKALPRIGPTATFFDLAPFLGAEQAVEIANERLSTYKR